MDQTQVSAVDNAQLRVNIENHIRQIDSFLSLVKGKTYDGFEVHTAALLQDYFKNIRSQLENKLGQVSNGQ